MRVVLEVVAQLVAFSFVIGSYLIHWALGLLVTVLWVFFVLPCFDMIFFEFDAKESPQIPKQLEKYDYVALIGLKAEAISDLRPQGLIAIGENKFNARSSLGFIMKGSSVKVIRALPGSVIVEEINKM